MINDKYLCQCGHTLVQHDIACRHMDLLHNGSMTEGLVLPADEIRYCICHKFKLDNLKYLEQMDADNTGL